MLNYFFVNWYRRFGRKFPWRQQGLSPFACLVTEILLRQTRAEQVAKIWPYFMGKYPDPSRLVGVAEDELTLDLWALGFSRQRCNALKMISQWLCEHHAGDVPKTEAELLNIPHVGVYTARAVLCFAFGQPVAIVDTNILRFFSRYHGLVLDRLDNRRAPEIWTLANAILPSVSSDVREHNYGLLDFTATICKPRKPKCVECPLTTACALGQRAQALNPRGL